MEPQRIILPTAFGMGGVNSWLIKGDEIVLIDCGEHDPESHRTLIAGLKEHKLTIADIDRVIITHAHVDHIGMAGWLAAEHGKEIWVSEKVAPWAVDPGEQWQLRKVFLQERMDFYIGAQAKFHFLAAFDSLMNGVHKVWHPIPIEHIRRFDSSGEFLIGGVRWLALYLPGHSATQTAFIHEDKGWLVSADALLRLIPTPVLELYNFSGSVSAPIVRLLESFHFLDSLMINRVYPGHFDIFDDAHDKLKEQITRLESRTDDCYSLISSGITDVFSLYNALYPGKFFLPAFNMTLAYIDLLLSRGRVIRIEEDEAVSFNTA